MITERLVCPKGCKFTAPVQTVASATVWHPCPNARYQDIQLVPEEDVK